MKKIYITVTCTKVHTLLIDDPVLLVSEGELCECLSDSPLHPVVIEQAVAVLSFFPVSVGHYPGRDNDGNVHTSFVELQDLVAQASVSNLVDSHLRVEI